LTEFDSGFSTYIAILGSRDSMGAFISSKSSSSLTPKSLPVS